MARIIDANKIIASTQKVVEAAAGYIVNGHYYDKNTMVPRPFKLISTSGNTEELAMSRRVSRWNGAAMWQKTVGDTVIVDRYDPTITYIFTTGQRMNSLTVTKLREQNGNADQIYSNTWAGIPTSYGFLRQYCGQDATYLYVLMEATTYNCYFGRIDKSSLVFSSVLNPSTYSACNSFKETENHIYFGVKRQYSLTYLYRYNKVTNLVEAIPTAARNGGTYYIPTNFCPPIVVADNDMYTYDLSYNATTLKLYFSRYKIDTTQTVLANISIETMPNVTWGSTVTQLPVLGSAATNKYELFTTKASNGKLYLNVAIMETMTASTPANIPSYGIYTFLITETRDLEFKNFAQVTSSYFRQFIGLRDHTFLACMSDEATIFMNFDESLEKFMVTDTLSNQPSHIGVDQAENIWIVNSLTEVDMLSPYVPTNVNVAFEKGTYKYEGVDYDSFITIDAKNYSGVNIATTLEITLKGNAVFKSNSTKTISEATLVSGVKIIPITIKGAGNISAYPKLIM